MNDTNSIDKNINDTGVGTSIGSSTCTFNQWSDPILVKTNEIGETIEFIYKETSMITYTISGAYPASNERVFKIIFSCKKGKWNKSERIYGTIIPAAKENYEF